MTPHIKNPNKLQPEKPPIGTTINTTESLIAALLENKLAEFILRSLYKQNNNTNLVKAISDVINLRNRSKESELIEALLSAASQVSQGNNFTDDKIAFDALLKLQTYKINEHMDPQNKIIAVYFPDSAYREQIGDILSKLRKANYNAMIFVGTICNDKHEKEAHVYYGGHGVIAQMTFVDLFICATYAHDLPANAKKVYFMHDIHDSPVSKEEDVLKMILEYDYHFVPSHTVLQRVKKQISQAREAGYLSEEKEIGLIQGGYSKLDQNIRLFKKYKNEDKTLIHAPTVVDPDVEHYACLPQYSEIIIDTLLDNFPDYKVIFRPHPHTLKTQAVSRIVDKHRDDPRFIFDNNASFYMTNYAKSALMVTDFSGTAFTYAFTTLRPVVFFSHNESAFKKAFEGYHYIHDRNKIGAVAQNTEELVIQIKSLLKKDNDFKVKIKKFRDSLIYNLGHSEDYFVDNIKYILNDQKHEDWIYLKVKPLPPQLIEEGYREFNIVYFNKKYFALSQELGSVNLEKVRLREVDNNLKILVGLSKSEVKNYVDWLTKSKKLLAETETQKLEIYGLKDIINIKEQNEKAATRKLEEKAGLLDQLTAEVSKLNTKANTLSNELEETHQELMELKQEVTNSNNRIKTLQTELQNNHLTIESLSNSSEVKTSQIDFLKKEIEQKNSQIDALSGVLRVREKWVQLLRDKYRTTETHNTDISHELKKIKSTLLYRLFK